MFLAPDGDELEITNAAADFMAGTIPLERFHGRNGMDLTTGSRLAFGEMGWFGLALPETRGGAGLGPVEHSLFFREVGRLCGPLDILAQALAAHVADEDLRPGILSGEIGVALAAPDRDFYRLLGASSASLAVLVTREGAQLQALDGMSIETRASLDPATSMRCLSALPATPAATTSGPDIWALAELGAAAMLVGLAEAALDMIVDYAKVRETFGRKIGSYQAVRHPCADMALDVEAARCQLWFAAAATKERHADAPVHIDAAKHLANTAAIDNADRNIQLHGGIGVTDEHHAHLVLKHALLLTKLFGTKRPLLARLLDARLEG